jgi:Dolichyl-phosphate-mannose-protein mannosyltransferase
MKIQKSDLLILLLWVVACVIFYNRIVPTDYFGYDEAEHMFAVSKGLYANYIDENSLSLFTFLKMGLEQGFQRQQSSSLSEFIRTREDITFYRHFHGPLYFYGLIIPRYFVGDDEYTARWTSLLFLILSIIAVYIGCLALLQENARVAAVIASALLMCSPSNITTAAQISAHGMYTLMAIITLCLMAKLLQTNDLRYWYCTIIAMALSFAVMEYAPLLLITFIICMFIQRGKLFINWTAQNHKQLFALSVILFIGVIFVVWPGAWLKLTLVKNYMFFTYLIFAREGEFGTRTAWEVWSQRFVKSPFEYILIIPLFLIALIHIKRHIFYLPFLLYSILMIIITFRNTSPFPTYISSLLPSLYILSGMVLADCLKHSKKLLNIVVPAAVVLVFSAYMWFYFIPYKSKEESYTPLKDLVNYFRVNALEDKRVLVDRRLLPTLHYYFPHKHFYSYRDKVGSMTSIKQELWRSSYDGVLYGGKNHYALEELLRHSAGIQPEIITISRDIRYYKTSAVQPRLHER